MRSTSFKERSFETRLRLEAECREHGAEVRGQRAEVRGRRAKLKKQFGQDLQDDHDFLFFSRPMDAERGSEPEKARSAVSICCLFKVVSVFLVPFLILLYSCIDFSKCFPASVSRYFCLLLRGLSGIIISIKLSLTPICW